MAQQIRIQKILAECGIASRRKSEEIIAAGRVRVNGKLAKIGDKASAKDQITVDGESIHIAQEKLYLALHKPRGFITTMQDEQGRKCVASLVADFPERVYPIGRLDRNSEGLLLMTNDGDFANKVMHPANHVPKMYRVTVRPAANEEQLNKLATGVMIDGRMTLPAKVKVLEESAERGVLEMVLYEGRNREIRKMCEAVGLEVARLKRTSVGPVRLGMLKQGAYRELTKEEMRILTQEIRKSEETPAKKVTSIRSKQARTAKGQTKNRHRF